MAYVLLQKPMGIRSGPTPPAPRQVVKWLPGASRNALTDSLSACTGESSNAAAGDTDGSGLVGRSECLFMFSSP